MQGTQTFYFPYILSQEAPGDYFPHIKEETKKKEDMIQETKRIQHRREGMGIPKAPAGWQV